MKKNKLKKQLVILGVVLLLLAAALGAAATFWTEYIWFAHLGFDSVYVTVLLAQVGTGVAYGLVALVVLAIHVVLIKRFSKPRKDWTIPTPEGTLDLKEIVSKVSTPVVVAAALIVATAMGYWASRHWEDVLKFFNHTAFGRQDPVLGKDIGFYLFTLPAMQFTQEWLVYLTGLCGGLSAIIYFARGEIVMKGRWPEMPAPVRTHLMVSIACVVAVIGWGYRIEMFETLFSKRGVAYGATYTDVNANLIAFRIMIGACAVVAVYLLVAARSRAEGKAALKWPAYALAGVVGLYVLGTFVWPTVVQKVVVKPNELEKERQYLLHAIAHTRDAYDLNKIEVKEFPAEYKLEMKDIKANRPTIDNIKIWDHRPLRSTYQQLQVIRLYYDFPNISVDRYRIGSNYWQVMLSARELVHSQLPAQSQTWVNQHLQYTHGYGACLSPVNQSTKEGLPNLWLKDIPPEARNSDLAITRPEIYYGLQTSQYVLVKTTTQEFDYPKGKENRYTTYQGEGGVGVGSFLRRLLFAIRFGDVNLFFTGHLKDESRILFNRNVQERIQTVAPFLMLDEEPYITVVDGRMYWIQDAYTISYRYPYSQPTSLGRRQRINYIRNSVKVVVDAFNGKVMLYVWDEKDPMIQTYRKIFPSLFKSKSEMRASLRRHVRFPKDLFTIQAEMYESFHMTDPRVWYNQEDKWNIARELAEKTVGRLKKPGLAPGRKGQVSARQVTRKSRMSPYYMIMKLPGQPKEEFLLMIPFTPNNKDNMVAWMTARCDGDNYGKLLVYAFPKKKLIFGPMQIEARIDQDAHISQWITLRNQQGSTVIRGDLLVIPIEDSLLYVEPIYLQATQTRLPELKQVIVAFGQHIAMRPTLAGALNAVFGAEKAVAVKPWKKKPVVPSKADAAKSAQALAGEALGHYGSGQQQLANGNWAGYGKEQAALKRKLEALSKVLEGKLKPPTSTPAGKPETPETPKVPPTKAPPAKAQPLKKAPPAKAPPAKAAPAKVGPTKGSATP